MWHHDFPITNGMEPIAMEISSIAIFALLHRGIIWKYELFISFEAQFDWHIQKAFNPHLLPFRELP